MRNGKRIWVGAVLGAVCVLAGIWLTKKLSEVEVIMAQVAGLNYEAVIDKMGHESRAQVIDQDACYNQMRHAVLLHGESRYGVGSKWEVLEVTWEDPLGRTVVWFFQEDNHWVAYHGLRYGRLVIF